MSFKSNYHQLADERKKLLGEWQKLSEIWQDQNSLNFKQDYIQALDRNLNTSLEAIKEFDDLFSTIVDHLNHD